MEINPIIGDQTSQADTIEMDMEIDALTITEAATSSSIKEKVIFPPKEKWHIAYRGP